MSWQAVARKEFQDSIRSNWLLGLSVLFVLLVSLAAAALGEFSQGTVTSSDVLSLLNGALVTTFVPLLALVVSSPSVSGERESGSLKLMLALPHSREDVVFGKFVGRSATMAVAVVVGFVLPGIVLAVTGDFEPLKYLGYILWIIVLSTVFVAIGTGISSISRTQWRSTAAMLGFYLLFVVFWVLLQVAGVLVLTLVLQSSWPDWMPYTIQETLLGLRVFNPTGSFKILTQSFLNDQLLASGGDVAFTQSTQLGAMLMLVFWVAAPLALGLWRFQRADL